MTSYGDIERVVNAMVEPTAKELREKLKPAFENMTGQTQAQLEATVSEIARKVIKPPDPEVVRRILKGFGLP
jgi:flagellar biosynthesis/type III secretory pathway protein FliH